MFSLALRTCKSKNLQKVCSERKNFKLAQRFISIFKPLYDKFEGEPPSNPLERIKWHVSKGSQLIKERLDNALNDDNEPFPTRKIFPTVCDVLIIGGGAMGSSVAYWLKETTGDSLDVVVVEKDFLVTNDILNLSEFEKASTVLSVGGLRQQFSVPENIEMSLYGAEFLRDINDHLGIEDEFSPNIQFQPDGYLFLASERGAETLQENSKLQNELGAKNVLLTPSKLKGRFPWINTDGIALACYGLEKEGWFDPWTLLQAYKTKATYLGAKYVEGEVVAFGYDESLTGVCSKSGEEHPFLDKVFVRVGPNDIREIQFSQCVIAAGAESGNVAKLAGFGTGKGVRSVSLPIEPRKRYVFNFRCPNGPSLNCPLTVDPSGAYFRREGFGGKYLAGLSPEAHEEPPSDDLEVDYTWFDEKIWPIIANRAPSFENIKVQCAWAGYYEYNTFDENGIVGILPTYHNLFVAAGFSGHGIQQSPAVGRAIMELICYSDYKTLNLDRLSPERLISNKPVFEKNIV